MARPNKDGLEYFSIDIDIMDEDSVGYVSAKYGLKAFGLLVRLLMKIYRNGYYTMWTEREQYLFTKDINVDIEETQTIVNAYINEGFFNQKLFNQYGILTSHGIQKRYIKACDRRSKIVMYQEYFLVDPVKDDLKLNNVTLIPVNVDKNHSSQQVTANITLTKTPQSKVKESKEKVKEIESKPFACAREDDQPVDNLSGDGLDGSDNNLNKDEAPTEEHPDFMSFWNVYPRRSGMPKAMEAWKEVIKNIPPKYLVLAAGKYAMKVKTDDTPSQYVKMPHTFLSDGVFKEYLPRNIPECPKCHGKGFYEVEEDGSMRVKRCDCRRELFGISN